MTSSLVSQLETRKTRLGSLETLLKNWSSKFSRIENESRDSRIETRGTVCLLLSGTVSWLTLLSCTVLFHLGHVWGVDFSSCRWSWRFVLLSLHHSSSAIWNYLIFWFSFWQILFFRIIDTGKGVLYTSDSDGIVFGESLPHHLVCLREFILQL